MNTTNMNYFKKITALLLAAIMLCAAWAPQQGAGAYAASANGGDAVVGVVAGAGAGAGAGSGSVMGAVAVAGSGSVMGVGAGSGSGAGIGAGAGMGAGAGSGSGSGMGAVAGSGAGSGDGSYVEPDGGTGAGSGAGSGDGSDDEPFNMFEIAGDSYDDFASVVLDIINSERDDYAGDTVHAYEDTVTALVAAASADDEAAAADADKPAAADYESAAAADADTPATADATPGEAAGAGSAIHGCTCADADDDYVLKQIILYVKDGKTLKDSRGAINTVTDGNGLYFLQYASEEQTESAFKSFEEDVGIRYVTPNRVVKAIGLEITGSAAVAPDGAVSTIGTAVAPDGAASTIGTAVAPDGAASTIGTAVTPDGTASTIGTSAGAATASGAGDASAYYGAIHAASGSVDRYLPNRWGSQMINADMFTDYLVNSAPASGLTVAVIDTGVTFVAPYLSGREVPGYNYVGSNKNTLDDNKHGTFVSAVIADCTPPGVKIMPIKALDKDGESDFFTVGNSIRYAANNGAKVINMSLGGECRIANCPIEQAINYAVARGVIPVAAACNDGTNAMYTCPAKLSNVITVTAVSSDKRPWSGSNYGPVVDLAAPGVDISSINQYGEIKQETGTSTATPYVSAGAAMVALEYGQYSSSQVKTVLKQCVSPFAGSPIRYYGTGILDFAVLFNGGDEPPVVKLNTNAINVNSLDAKYKLYQLTATVTPSYLIDKSVTYSSSNTGVAVCDGNGVVEIKGDGAATITVMAKAGGVTDICVVNVKAGDSAFWISAASNAFAGGDGTQANPYKIAAPGQLALLARNSLLLKDRGGGLNEDEYYELTSDIDLSGKAWISIGLKEGQNDFRGHFNGAGHVIKNMRQGYTAVGWGGAYSGLFCRVRGEIYNLGVIYADIKASGTAAAPPPTGSAGPVTAPAAGILAYSATLGQSAIGMIGGAGGSAAGGSAAGGSSGSAGGSSAGNPGGGIGGVSGSSEGGGSAAGGSVAVTPAAVAVSNCYTSGSTPGAALIQVLVGEDVNHTTANYLPIVISNCCSTAAAPLGFVETTRGAEIRNSFYYGGSMFVNNCGADELSHASGAPVLDGSGLRVSARSRINNCIYVNKSGTGSFVANNTGGDIANCYYYSSAATGADADADTGPGSDTGAGADADTGPGTGMGADEGADEGADPGAVDADAGIRPMPLSFFMSIGSFTDAANWDARYPWDFSAIWAIGASTNDGLPYLKRFPVIAPTPPQGGGDGGGSGGGGGGGGPPAGDPSAAGQDAGKAVDATVAAVGGSGSAGGGASAIFNKSKTSAGYKDIKVVLALGAYELLRITHSVGKPAASGSSGAGKPAASGSSGARAAATGVSTANSVSNAATGVSTAATGSSGARAAATGVSTATAPAATTLVKGRDYKQTGNVITFTKLYLAKLDAGEHIFTFEMNGGINPVFSIMIEDDNAVSGPIVIAGGGEGVNWANPFTDVNPADWFYNDVAYAYIQGLFKGVSETLFGPDLPMTRAMLVTVLYRFDGSPDLNTYANPFGDLGKTATGADEYYVGPVLWAASNGIVLGDMFGNFRPDDPIKRQEFATILVRYALYAGIEMPFPDIYESFTDADDISDYAFIPIQILYKAEILRGVGLGYVDPLGSATRAQVAAMLHRF